MAIRITELCNEVHDNIEQANSKYKMDADAKQQIKEFQEGDLVVIHLRKVDFEHAHITN